MIKKILLSAALVMGFGGYALAQRFGGGSGRQVSPPQNLAPLNPAPASSTPSGSPQAAGSYKDGRYTGPVTDAFYGNVQVRATITGGRLTNVEFLQYPNDRRNSIEINTQAMPYLKAEAISAQSANVDIVSGATQTSEAFIKSLGAALGQAQI